MAKSRDNNHDIIVTCEADVKQRKPLVVGGFITHLLVLLAHLPAAACRQEHAIVLRPPSFQDHNPQFIIKFDTAAAAAAAAGSAAAAAGQQAVYSCSKIPHHPSTTSHWWQLLTQQQQQQLLVLMQPGSRIMHVLSKFEPQLQFIHAYVPSDSVACSNSSSSTVHAVPVGADFELPRFGLEFKLQLDGKLGAKDYVLAEQQQLAYLSTQKQSNPAIPWQHAACAYTLPEFSQYLVLESKRNSSSSSSTSSAVLPGAGRSSMRLLIPAGDVCRSSSSSSGGWGQERIDINLDGASGAALNVSASVAHR
jgi:hypothetical protein